jgi:dTMP kinase
MREKHFYGKGIPGADPSKLGGTLIVIEGSDGSGRSTQIALLKDWLERRGYATVDMGLKRSELAGEELASALSGNTLSPLTFSLFYATDFADQMERTILPALRAGFVVLADRYIYTLMARDIARGVSAQWLKDVYNTIALVPDAVFYLKVRPAVLAERVFRKNGQLDYWESGMDIKRQGDMYENFIRYQTLLQKVFSQMNGEYGFQVVHGDRKPWVVFKDLRSRIEKILPVSDRVWGEEPREYDAEEDAEPIPSAGTVASFPAVPIAPDTESNGTKSIEGSG